MARDDERMRVRERLGALDGRRRAPVGSPRGGRWDLEKIASWGHGSTWGEPEFGTAADERGRREDGDGDFAVSGRERSPENSGRRARGDGGGSRFAESVSAGLELGATARDNAGGRAEGEFVADRPGGRRFSSEDIGGAGSVRTSAWARGDGGGSDGGSAADRYGGLEPSPEDVRGAGSARWARGDGGGSGHTESPSVEQEFGADETDGVGGQGESVISRPGSRERSSEEVWRAGLGRRAPVWARRDGDGASEHGGNGRARGLGAVAGDSRGHERDRLRGSGVGRSDGDGGRAERQGWAEGDWAGEWEDGDGRRAGDSGWDESVEAPATPEWLSEPAGSIALWHRRFVPERFRGLRLHPGRRGVLALAGVGVAAVVMAAGATQREKPVAQPVPPLPAVQTAGVTGTATSAAPPAPTSEPPPAELVVSVVGLVQHVGLMHLPAGSRVADAVAAAVAEQGADLARLNLAQRLADGDQVVVGALGPNPGPPQLGSAIIPGGERPGSARTSGAATPAAARVDLNTATESELDSLPGVGPATARNILSWRTEHGRFTSIDQLSEIPGIGPSRLNRLRDLVTL